MKMKTTILALAGSLVLSCSQSQKVSPSAILVKNVHVVDVLNGAIIENQQVVIDSGLIQKMETDLGQIDAYANQIDGEGKFLMPGLAEMHAHIPSPPTSDQRIEETLFLYLSNGITTIRGMLGHPIHVELKQRVAGGDLLSPRIWTSSPSLNGNSVPTKEEAESKVRAYADAGYDFLKIHPGIKLEVFEVLAATANEEGIPYAGHVPVDVGILRALQSNYATIDHVDGFLEGLVPPEAIDDPGANGFFGYGFTRLADPEKIPDLVQMSKAHGVWVVPTQTLFERWFAPTTADEMLSQPEMQYMPQTTLDNWRNMKIQATGPDSGFDPEQWKEFIEIRRKLIRAIKDEGQGILLGSDAPQVFNVPGFSIHHEIKTMLDAGMSPLEILQSGTINVAEYLGVAEQSGQIKAGFWADAVLLSANPLEDLSALKKMEGVFIQGRWIDKEFIDNKLSEIAANAR